MKREKNEIVPNFNHCSNERLEKTIERELKVLIEKANFTIMITMAQDRFKEKYGTAFLVRDIDCPIFGVQNISGLISSYLGLEESSSHDAIIEYDGITEKFLRKLSKKLFKDENKIKYYHSG